jgi:hypothetical protein
VSKLGDDIGGSGRNKEKIGFVSEFDMGGLPALVFIVKIGDDWIAGKSFEGNGRDKAEGVRGEDYVEIATLLGEQAGEIGGFIGRDGAGDA